MDETTIDLLRVKPLPKKPSQFDFFIEKERFTTSKYY